MMLVERNGMDNRKKYVKRMRKRKREKVKKSKRGGSEWTREEQRQKGGTPATRGVTSQRI